jgi:hypothetical protein
MEHELIKTNGSSIQPWQQLASGLQGKLTDTENDVLRASMSVKIKDIPADKYVDEMSVILNYTAIDVGFVKPNLTEWNYLKMKLCETLKKYFYGFTLKEVKLAFELLQVGQLDNYLPLNSSGNPERQHYNRFGIEYFSRVLKAYLGLKNEVIAKVYQNGITAEPKKLESSATADIRHSVYLAYLHYKYLGTKPTWPNNHLIYRELNRANIIDDIDITEADKRQAMRLLMQDVHSGLIGDFVGKCIRHLGAKHPDVNDKAYIVAQERTILQAFDEYILNEIQLDKYL